MLQIQNTLVSLDFAEDFFCCDLDKCLGACCIDGDAGAPITPEEKETIEQVYPYIKDDLLPRAVEKIEKDGVAYIDEEGDLVTTIIDGRDCAFTCYASGGLCHCAIERAFRKGDVKFRKPISCFLYPARLTEYKDFIAVNRHRWKICRPAETLGRKLNIRLYQFLKEPLTERFGKEWYDELVLACEAWLEQKNG